MCYCHDDRKINNFAVYQIPKQNFAVSQGEPKVYTKKSHHGNVRIVHIPKEVGLLD